MKHDSFLVWLVIVAISEMVALWLIRRLWRSDDYLFFKVSLSILALVPVVGPLLMLWIGNFPPIQPFPLQDRSAKSTDVLDRWRSVFDTKNPVKRFRLWRDVMTRDDKDR